MDEQAITKLHLQKDEAQLRRHSNSSAHTATALYGILCSTELDSAGYDANYRLETVTLGELTLQCLTVDPSHTQSEDGVQASHAGMRKYYRSDGDYLFSPEVSCDLPESTDNSRP